MLTVEENATLPDDYKLQSFIHAQKENKPILKLKLKHINVDLLMLNLLSVAVLE